MSSLPKARPTRMPASEKALEKVRSTTRLGKRLTSAMALSSLSAKSM